MAETVRRSRDMKKTAPLQTPDSDEERRQLGERLRQAREYLGLSQEDVATYLKVPRTALTGVESGQRRVEAIELKRLAELYRQPVSYFTGEDAAAAALPADVAHLARAAAKLSVEDREELGRFAEYLRARSGGERSKV
jgi:transcriptional regulator with XRE-family HTH domain